MLNQEVQREIKKEFLKQIKAILENLNIEKRSINAFLRNKCTEFLLENIQTISLLLSALECIVIFKSDPDVRKSLEENDEIQKALQICLFYIMAYTDMKEENKAPTITILISSNFKPGGTYFEHPGSESIKGKRLDGNFIEIRDEFFRFDGFSSILVVDPKELKITTVACYNNYPEDLKELTKSDKFRNSHILFLNGERKNIEYYHNGELKGIILYNRKLGTYEVICLHILRENINNLIREKLKNIGDENLATILYTLIKDIAFFASKEGYGTGFIIGTREAFNNLITGKKIIDASRLKKYTNYVDIRNVSMSFLLNLIKRDGHILMMPDGRLFADSAFLRLPGGRHKSVESLIRRYCRNCIGLVISVDGPISLYYYDRDEKNAVKLNVFELSRIKLQ